MSDYLKVEGHSELVRDPNTQAIINKDRSAYENYMAREKALEKKNSEFDTMKEELYNVKSDIGDIKDMLSSIVQKLNS